MRFAKKQRCYSAGCPIKQTNILKKKKDRPATCTFQKTLMLLPICTNLQPLIKQIIRILFVLNPSPQLFIIGFYAVVFLHDEEDIFLHHLSYLRESFRLPTNDTDLKMIN